MIDTAGTICNAANAIKDLGARSVRAAATHPVLSGPAIDRDSEDSAIEELVLLNTVPLPEEKKLIEDDIPVSRSAFCRGNDKSIYQRLHQRAVRLE